MSKRSHKRALKGRDSRRADYDLMRLDVRKGRKRPGSLNPKRSTPTAGKRK